MRSVLYRSCLLLVIPAAMGCDREYGVGTSGAETVSIPAGQSTYWTFEVGREMLGTEFNLNDHPIHARLVLRHIQGPPVHAVVLDKANFSRFENTRTLGEDAAVPAESGLLYAQPKPLHSQLIARAARSNFESGWVRLTDDMKTDERDLPLSETRMLYLVVENTSSTEPAVIGARLVVKNKANP